MSNCAVFLTAPDVATKVLNRALILLQDFEFSDWETSSPYVLLTNTTLPTEAPKASLPPIAESTITHNEFFSKTASDVNTFMRSHEETLKKFNLSSSVWIIIDAQGVESETVLLCEQSFDDDSNESTHEFRACRVPYIYAWSMYANLDIANADFEDYVLEDDGVLDDGTWRFNPDVAHEESELVRGKREDALKRLRDGGFVD